MWLVIRPEIVVYVVVALLISAVLAYCLCVIAGEAEEEAEIARSNLRKERKENEHQDRKH